MCSLCDIERMNDPIRISEASKQPLSEADIAWRLLLSARSIKKKAERDLKDALDKFQAAVQKEIDATGNSVHRINAAIEELDHGN